MTLAPCEAPGLGGGAHPEGLCEVSGGSPSPGVSARGPRPTCPERCRPPGRVETGQWSQRAAPSPPCGSLPPSRPACSAQPYPPTPVSVCTRGTGHEPRKRWDPGSSPLLPLPASAHARGARGWRVCTRLCVSRGVCACRECAAGSVRRRTCPCAPPHPLRTPPVPGSSRQVERCPGIFPPLPAWASSPLVCPGRKGAHRPLGPVLKGASVLPAPRPS